MGLGSDPEWWVGNKVRSQKKRASHTILQQVAYQLQNI